MGTIYHHLSPWGDQYRRYMGFTFTTTQVPGFKIGLVSQSNNGAVQNFSNKCWEKFIKGKSINGLPMHAKSAHYGVCWKSFFISYVHISHVESLASIDTSVWTLNTFPGILSFECRDIEGISDMLSRVSWHIMTLLYKCK